MIRLNVKRKINTKFFWEHFFFQNLIFYLEIPLIVTPLLKKYLFHYIFRNNKNVTIHI